MTGVEGWGLGGELREVSVPFIQLCICNVPIETHLLIVALSRDVPSIRPKIIWVITVTFFEDFSYLFI